MKGIKLKGMQMKGMHAARMNDMKQKGLEDWESLEFVEFNEDAAPRGRSPEVIVFQTCAMINYKYNQRDGAVTG